MKTCRIKGCTAPSKTRGLCNRHYLRWWRGRPLADRELRGRQDGYRIKAGKLEHRAVVERAMGKPLRRGAVIHHINGNKADNRPSNLVVCPNEAYHSLLHRRQDALAACGHADWRRCRFCGQYDRPEKLVHYMHGRGDTGFHILCRQINRK